MAWPGDEEGADAAAAGDGGVHSAQQQPQSQPQPSSVGGAPSPSDAAAPTEAPADAGTHHGIGALAFVPRLLERLSGHHHEEPQQHAEPAPAEADAAAAAAEAAPASPIEAQNAIWLSVPHPPDRRHAHHQLLALPIGDTDAAAAEPPALRRAVSAPPHVSTPPVQLGGGVVPARETSVFAPPPPLPQLPQPSPPANAAVAGAATDGSPPLPPFPPQSRLPSPLPPQGDVPAPRRRQLSLLRPPAVDGSSGDGSLVPLPPPSRGDPLTMSLLRLAAPLASSLVTGPSLWPAAAASGAARAVPPIHAPPSPLPSPITPVVAAEEAADVAAADAAVTRAPAPVVPLKSPPAATAAGATTVLKTRAAADACSCSTGPRSSSAGSSFVEDEDESRPWLFPTPYTGTATPEAAAAASGGGGGDLQPQEPHDATAGADDVATAGLASDPRDLTTVAADVAAATDVAGVTSAADDEDAGHAPSPIPPLHFRGRHSFGDTSPPTWYTRNTPAPPSATVTPAPRRREGGGAAAAAPSPSSSTRMSTYTTAVVMSATASTTTSAAPQHTHRGLDGLLEAVQTEVATVLRDEVAPALEAVTAAGTGVGERGDSTGDEA